MRRAGAAGTLLFLLAGCAALATASPADALAAHPCDTTVAVTASDPFIAEVSPGGTGTVTAALANSSSTALTGLSLRVRLVAPAPGAGAKPALSVAVAGAPPRTVTMTSSPDGWQSQDIPVPKIQPNATVPVTLRVTFPADSVAGRYDAPLTVRAGGCADPVGSSSALGFDVVRPAPSPSGCACPSTPAGSPQPSAPPGGSVGTSPGAPGRGAAAGSGGGSAPAAGPGAGAPPSNSDDTGGAALSGARAVQHAVVAVAGAAPLPWVTWTGVGALLCGLLGALVVRRLRTRARGADPVGPDPLGPDPLDAERLPDVGVLPGA